jgi:hypothetical protein
MQRGNYPAEFSKPMRRSSGEFERLHEVNQKETEWRSRRSAGMQRASIVGHFSEAVFKRSLDV